MPATILVTEDAPSVREMLAWELSGRGFEVVTAGDCNEAVAALHRAEFDVLVSDVRCGLDADKLLATSRRLAPDTELVVAADADNLAAALACVRGGAFDYVAKPFDVDDLTATITRALERRQLRASTVLYEASRAILDANEPQRLPETIVRVAMKVMNADDVSLMLLGPGDRLYVAYSHGLPLALARDVHHGLGERVAGIVAESREPALLGEVLEHDARFANVASYRRVRSSIVYPITAGTRLVGVLNVNRVAEARPFRKLDLDKAAVLASQILLALDNERLLRQIATTQQLTTIGQVSASVVHEINNPISYVLASEQHLRERLGDVRQLCEAIERGGEPADLRALLERAGGGTVLLDDLAQAADDIRDGAGRVRDIMRDLRSLARNRESRPVVFELATAIRSAQRVVAAELRHKASVITDLADGIMLSGSPGRVSQVFVNLLVNSAEAFGPNGPHVVEIIARRDDNRAIVTVRDDGPGIAREHLSRVFEPFFTTKATKRSGLGLSISRDIVRDQGGDIRVDTEPGRGTTVTITLPCLPDAALVAEPVPQTPPAKRRLKIVFIDDERTILRGYTRRFSREHDVVAAASGAEALKLFGERSDFDLVICDLSMPEVNGMDVYMWCRDNAPTLAEKFVFATGGATQRDLEAFLAAVPNEVLEKPFELAAIQALIDRARMR